jgi:hypothetical protein
MNAERIAIAGWGTLESWPGEDDRDARRATPRWVRPWKSRILALGRFIASAVEVAVDAVLVLIPGA